MSDTTSNSSFSNNRRSQAYAKTGISKCNVCKSWVPYTSFSEHMALKHHVKAVNDSDQNEENAFVKPKSRRNTADTRKAFSEIRLNKIVDNTGDPVSKSVSSKIDRNDVFPSKSHVKNHFVDNNNDGSFTEDGEKIQTNILTGVNDIYRSEFREPKLNKNKRNARKVKDTKKSVAAEMADEPMVMPVIKPEREGRTMRRTADMYANKKPSRSASYMRPTEVQHHVQHGMNKPPRRDISWNQQSKRQIPTVFDMFNMGRSNAVNCGPYPEMRKVDDELPGYESATQQRSPRKPIIPEHCVKCPVCEHIMHKDHLKGHLQRKHYAENNGVPIIYEGYHKCEICQNLMPKEHIQTHIERAHGNEMQNKDTFINCNLCEAYMHIDYMPGHLVRKHARHEGSVGIIWPQYSDDQIYDWLRTGAIYIRDGTIFVDHTMWR